MVAGTKGTLKRLTATPNSTASTMNHRDAVAAAGTATKVLATTIANTAITSTRADQANTRNRTLPVTPTCSSTTSPMDLPWWRRLATMAMKSWAAPMKIPPSTSHT